MKKTTDEELNAWRYQFPTAIVSLRIVGDPVYARGFMGEGKVLLHSVINAMKFNNLGQHQNEKRFSDGTVVRAKSIFGHNTVEIDVSKSSIFAIPGKEECTITFVYLNKYVQPMHYPGEVRGGEQEGIDYVKTYYTFDKSKCPSCEDEIEWEFTFNYETKEQIDYYDSEPNNHCVYSQDQGCSGEIIEQGRDDDGDYIIWKVYTEASNHNRSGLGYAQFHAILRNKNTEEIVCEFDEIIGVDCCEKDTEDKVVTLLANKDQVDEWKTDCAVPPRSDCDSYPSCEDYWDWCEVPPELPMDALLEVTYFRARPPEKVYGEGETLPPGDGSCLPYEWTLLGKGAIETNGDFKESLIYTPVEGDCEEITIIVKDRCETTQQTIRPPCDTAIDIGYTSLLMGCGESQTLTAVGCPPFVWTLVSGGGTLTPTDDTLTAEYESPATNPNCVDNPTIKLEDRCENSKELELTINCNPSGIAYWQTIYEDVGANSYCANTRNCLHKVYWYNCNGLLNSSPYNPCVGNFINPCLGVPCNEIVAPVCDLYGRSFAPPGQCYDCGGGNPPYLYPYKCILCSTWECDGWWSAHKGCSDCADGDGIDYHGHVCDKRTQAMKDGGCCPINPETGLPF